MELYLEHFEQAISKQSELLGEEKAFAAAKEAGLSVDTNGRVVSCTGNPVVVLLRLIRAFATMGNLAALENCSELINKITEIAEELEPNLNQASEHSTHS